MVSDGVISCAYRLFGRLPSEAHSDLPMMFHESVMSVTRGVTGTHEGKFVVIICVYFYSDNNLCTINCVCVDYMTDRGWWLSAMQKAGEGVFMCGEG